MVLPNILTDSVKEWLKYKRLINEAQASPEAEETKIDFTLPTRNLPVALILQEAVHRFEEVVGARPETVYRVQGGIFSGMDSESVVHLDWTEERPRSQLASALL